ncbi:MAG TPA: OsmC family protein [Anaerolineales bacterium]|nr:OsmC family protein [Anaerolineales bacterium]
MYAGVTWHEGLSFTGTARSGFEVKLGSSQSGGEAGGGFRPLELIGIGLAGCTAMDVISILQKKRQDVTGFEVTVDVEQADEHPHVFTKIVIHYLVTGNEIDPADVERAIELSRERYCPASAMLGKAAAIEDDYRILSAGG